MYRKTPKFSSLLVVAAGPAVASHPNVHVCLHCCQGICQILVTRQVLIHICSVALRFHGRKNGSLFSMKKYFIYLQHVQVKNYTKSKYIPSTVSCPSSAPYSMWKKGDLWSILIYQWLNQWLSCSKVNFTYKWAGNANEIVANES